MTRRKMIGLSLCSAIARPALAFRIDAQDKLRYRVDKPPASSRELTSRFSPDQVELLEKLNRCDRDHLIHIPALVTPAEWDLGEVAYSPLPAEYEWVTDRPKAFLVYLPGQAFGAYESGRLVRWGPVNSGRLELPTPPGEYHLTWRSPGRPSSENPDWFLKWYYNFDNAHGFSFHAYTMPGYPASHGCVRMLERDAQWLYEWGDSWQLSEDGMGVESEGTPVWVFGPYDYKRKPPWRSNGWLSKPVDLPSILDLHPTAALQPQRYFHCVSQS